MSAHLLSTCGKVDPFQYCHMGIHFPFIFLWFDEPLYIRTPISSLITFFIITCLQVGQIYILSYITQLIPEYFTQNFYSFFYMMYIQCILFFRFTSRRLFSQYLQIYGIISLIWAVCRFQIGKDIFFYFREIILQWFNFKGLSAILYMYILFVWRCIWTLLALFTYFFMIDHSLYVFTLYIMPLIYNLYICLTLSYLCLHIFEPAVHFLYWKVVIKYIYVYGYVLNWPCTLHLWLYVCCLVYPKLLYNYCDPVYPPVTKIYIWKNM